MQITTNNGKTTITFQVSPKGQLSQIIQTGKSTLIRTTNDTSKMVKMLCGESTWTDNIIRTAKVWWGLKDSETVRGTFNEQLYRKIQALRGA